MAAGARAAGFEPALLLPYSLALRVNALLPDVVQAPPREG